MITTAQKTTIKDLSVSDPEYTTDLWVSFEGNSGIALNHIVGYGYAQIMRTGGTISANSGVVLSSAEELHYQVRLYHLEFGTTTLLTQ